MEHIVQLFRSRATRGLRGDHATSPPRTSVVIVISLFLATLLTGCSWYPLTKHQRKGSSAEKIDQTSEVSWESAGIAVGGVVLGPEAPLDHLCGIPVPYHEFDYGEQSDMWAYYLYSALDKHSEKTTIYTWPTVRDQVPDSTTGKLHEVFAHMGVLRPERLQPFLESFPLADFLVIARVDYIFLEHRTRQASGLHSSIGRTIEVTLECYDLHTGKSVWRSTKKKHSNGKKLGPIDDSENRAMVHKMDDGDVDVGVPGTSVSAPTLDEMIPKCINSLVASMLGSKSSF